VIALLALTVTAGIVLALYAGYRHWLLVRRSAGEVVQDLVKPTWSEALFWISGLTTVLSMMALLLIEPVVYRAGGWSLVVVFAVAAFEVACWASGVYRFAFHERGLWYGRSWYPYRELHSYEIDRDRVRLVARGRVLTFQTVGTLAPEVRLKLSVEGFS